MQCCYQMVGGGGAGWVHRCCVHCVWFSQATSRAMAWSFEVGNMFLPLLRCDFVIDVRCFSITGASWEVILQRHWLTLLVIPQRSTVMFPWRRSQEQPARCILGTHLLTWISRDWICLNLRSPTVLHSASLSPTLSVISRFFFQIYLH